jgi:hypothetical protein
MWLREHNSLYADGDISEAQLSELPENRVPQEILDSICYSDDVEQLERSRSGYVNEEDDLMQGVEVPHCVAGMDDLCCWRAFTI